MSRDVKGVECIATHDTLEFVTSRHHNILGQAEPSVLLYAREHKLKTCISEIITSVCL